MPAWQRFARWLGHVWCGLTTGHRYIREQHDTRWHLVCWYCNHESPGWKLKG